MACAPGNRDADLATPSGDTREEGDMSCKTLVGSLLSLLVLVAQVGCAVGVPLAQMTVRSFWRGVAQLGGFQGRRSDGEPGWKTLWRGWVQVDAMVQGARLAASLLG